MNENKPISKSRDTVYRAVIIAIVAVAAYSNATKELSRLHEALDSAHQVTAQGLGSLATVYAATKSFGQSLKPTEAPELSAIEGLRWNRTLAAGGSIELSGLNREKSAEPGTTEVNVQANTLSTNKAHVSDLSADDFRSLESLEGFTARAISPIKGADESSSCDLAKREQLKVAGREVRLKLLAELPEGTPAEVRSFGRNASFEVVAAALSGKDFPETMQRFIKIAKRINARGRTVKSDATAKPAAWPQVDFKTTNRVIALDPSTANDDFQLQILHTEGSPDIHLNLPARTNLKHVGSESEN